MLNLLKVALPTTLLLIAPTTAAAAPNEIIVTAPEDAELRRWTVRVEQAIARQMRFPRALGPTQPPTGLVDVTFRCSEDGSPSDVTVSRTSGSRQVDLAGVRAIKRLKALHPLVEGISHDQIYKARLLFADSERMAKQIGALRRDAQAGNSRLLQRMGERTAVSLTLLPRNAF